MPTVGLSLPGTRTELITTPLLPLLSSQPTWGCQATASGSGGPPSLRKQSRRKGRSPPITSTRTLSTTSTTNTTSTRIRSITQVMTTRTWRRSSWMNSVIFQVSHKDIPQIYSFDFLFFKKLECICYLFTSKYTSIFNVQHFFLLPQWKQTIHPSLNSWNLVS